jgi:uncharacterized membrane protein
MLEFLSLIIKIGIEFLFFLMLLTNFLQLRNLQKLIPWLFYGSVFGSFGALIIYIVKKYFIRLEVLDVVEKGLLFLIVCLCVFWVISQYRNQMEKYGKVLLFILSFVLALEQMELVLLASIPQLSMTNGMNTEWIGKIAFTAIAAMLLLLMALGMKRLGPKMNSRFVFILFIFQSFILFSKELTELLQMLFSLQILPLTMWALDVLAPVVNHKEYFFYSSSLTIIIFLFYSSLSICRYIREKDVDFANPAEKRKSFAQSVRIRRWFYSFTTIQIVFFSFLASAQIIQAKAVTTNPPVEVTAHEGQIHISNKMLEETGLNVFSYNFQDHSEVRFMAVGKTKENYGVALDACAICGVAGYYQKGEQIICKKCNSVINVNTIGFTGGCNPIPMEYENQGNGELNIPVSELEKSKSLFQ